MSAPTVVIRLPYLHILTLIFITLKLTGYIAWSWWLVLLPTLITFALGLLILVAAFVIVAIASNK